MKSKIALVQLVSNTKDSKDSKPEYLVTGLVNRTVPKIGAELTEKEVKYLISEGRGQTTIEIKGKAK